MRYSAVHRTSIRSIRILAGHFERFAHGDETKEQANKEIGDHLLAFARQFSADSKAGLVFTMRHEEKHYMYILKFICMTIIQLIKQVWLFPQTIANAVKQRRGQVVRNELEAERLDRIRNPSKYLGK